MRRRFLVPVIALALPLLFAPAVAASPGVQTPDSLGQTLYNASWTPSNYIAQTFTTPNKLERLDSVELFVFGSTKGGTIEANITAGAPGSTPIAGTDVTATVNPGADHAWISLTPPTSIVLTANTQYSIVFTVQGPPGDTSDTLISEYCSAGGYSGGAAYVFDGTSWTTPGTSDTPCAQDLGFQVFMSPLPGTLDQRQDVHDTFVFLGGDTVLAQTFIASSAGTLNAVSLWSNGPDGSTNVTVELCSVSDVIDCSGASPIIAKPDVDSGVLASSTVTIPNGAVQWFNFVFSTPPTITATEYAIVVFGNGGWTGSRTDTYDNGVAEYSDGGPWAPIGGAPVRDLAFQTFITPAAATPPPTSPPAAAPTPTSPAAAPTPTSRAVTPPPTSSAGTVPGSGSSDPMPLILVLMAAIPVAVIILARRYGVFARR
jgi:hypothetical protein